jgi:hypothetical protein
MLPGDFTVSEGHGHPLVVLKVRLWVVVCKLYFCRFIGTLEPRRVPWGIIRANISYVMNMLNKYIGTYFYI